MRRFINFYTLLKEMVVKVPETVLVLKKPIFELTIILIFPAP